MSEAPTRDEATRPKPLTVAEFNRSAKGAIEERFASVWVEGEIASCKIAASGHAYFDLKDEREEARVSCCLFRGQLSRARASIRDGERVQLHARASLYPARGSFQLIVDTVLPAGAGSAAAALEALKRKLAAEGLLAQERKRALPRFPRAVGVVTSQAGAAFGDICRVMHRRWPAHIVLAPTSVQGADAPARIVLAIEAIQRVRAVEVVIVGRGGGASDDLLAFNDERVARAIAACRVPVISAVGHEIDQTLADLVADVRASTPSNAAELCVPEMREVRESLDAFRSRMGHGVRARVNARRVTLARWEKKLGDPRRFTAEARQRLDDALSRMVTAMRTRSRTVARTLADHSARLERAHPRTRVARDRGTLASAWHRLAPLSRRIVDAHARRLAELRGRLAPSVHTLLASRRAAFETRVATLEALSPLAILSRGYGVVFAGGKALTDAADVSVGDDVTLRLHRGELLARVLEKRGG